MEVSKTDKRRYILNLITILLIYLVSTTGSYEKAAVQICIEAWPAVGSASIRSMITLPSLVCMIVMLLTSPLVGSKIKFKTAALIGTVCITIGGLLPIFFFPSWTFVLVCRALIGVGTGFLGTRNALMLKSVPKEEASKWIGFGGVAMNITSIACAPIAGALSEISCNYAFFVNIFAPVALVMVLLFLVEPMADEKTVDVHGTKVKEPMNKMVFVYAAISLVATLSLYPLLSGMSTYFVENELGNATMVGTVLAFYTLGGLIANANLKLLQKFYGRLSISISAMIVMVGQGIVLYFPNIVTTFIGTTLCGFGFYTIFSMLQVYNGKVQPLGGLAFSSTIMLAAGQLAIYVSSYFISACKKIIPMFGESEVSKAFFGCLVVYSIIFLVGLIKKVVPEEKK